MKAPLTANDAFEDRLTLEQVAISPISNFALRSSNSPPLLPAYEALHFPNYTFLRLVKLSLCRSAVPSVALSDCRQLLRDEVQRSTSFDSAITSPLLQLSASSFTLLGGLTLFRRCCRRVANRSFERNQSRLPIEKLRSSKRGENVSYLAV